MTWPTQDFVDKVMSDPNDDSPSVIGTDLAPRPKHPYDQSALERITKAEHSTDVPVLWIRHMASEIISLRYALLIISQDECSCVKDGAFCGPCASCMARNVSKQTGTIL